MTNDYNNLELTEEETKKVNNIITGIQSDLEKAIQLIKNGDFDKALLSIQNSLKRTECPICQKKLKLLTADIEHNKKVCELDEEMCLLEKKEVIANTSDIKDEFVPIATKKKFLKDKEKGLPSKEKIKILTPLKALHSIFSPTNIR